MILPETRAFEDATGRGIGWCELGDPVGLPVLAAHGSPGSRYQLLALDAAARAAGVRIIAPDRPGFGITEPGRDRGFHSWDPDAVALLDHLALDAVTVLGFSGGAGYALALALAQPQRVSRLVLACGMIPGAPRAALRDRMPLISALYAMSRWLPPVAVAMLEGRGPFRNTREANYSAWPEPDQFVMTDPKLKELTGPDGKEGMRQGARAAVTDLGRFHRSIDLGSVSAPVTMLHGTADVNVPIAVARWARDRLPHARLEEVAGGGHYFAAINPELVIRALSEPA